jgi:hypothetical protein
VHGSFGEQCQDRGTHVAALTATAAASATTTAAATTGTARSEARTETAAAETGSETGSEPGAETTGTEAAGAERALRSSAVFAQILTEFSPSLTALLV